MTTADSPALETSASRYLEIGQHVLFGILLSLGAIRALHLESLGVDGHRGEVALGVAALTALWYVGGAVFGRYGAPRATSRPGRRGRLVWFGGLVAGWIALVGLSPDFSWVAFALFLLCIHLLPTRAALIAIALITAVVIAAQIHSGIGNPVGQFAGPIIGAIVAAGTGLIYRRILAESEQRRRLVAELVAAQDDLVAVHDELADTQREAGVLAERQRLARDIHDTLAQGFSSIVLLSRAGLSGGDEAARERILGQIESTAEENLEEARRVVHALGPAGLDDAPLTAALRRLVGRLEEQTGIATTVDIDGVGSLGTTQQVAVLRIAQSALANVRLHSGADRMALTLARVGDGLVLDVVDDGRGFDPGRLDAAPLGGTGFGLRAMRERLAALGGTLVVDSTPGEGTALTATIPMATGSSATGPSPTDSTVTGSTSLTSGRITRGPAQEEA